VTAATRQPIGVIRADPDLRATFEAAMRETWSVGRARGIALPDDFVASQMAFGDGLPAEMKASMLHDLEAGSRLEAPWLSGAVARMAQEAGTSAPVNATLYAALKPYCAAARLTDRRRTNPCGSACLGDQRGGVVPVAVRLSLGAGRHDLGGADRSARARSHQHADPAAARAADAAGDAADTGPVHFRDQRALVLVGGLVRRRVPRERLLVGVFGAIVYS
jgi:hypothetical protein